MPSLDQLFIAYLAYFIGTATPGPGNLSIMATSLDQGRPAGMALACGIVTGGQCWGISAAIGLGALMVLWPSTFASLKHLKDCFRERMVLCCSEVACGSLKVCFICSSGLN